MAFTRLSFTRVKAILDALNPWFQGRHQDALLGALDQTAGQAYDDAYDLTQPLFQFRSDIQSPAGAGMVGILDAGNHFTGTTVEAALDELYTLGTGTVIDSIADADTTHAPSRNAVFDALALKANLASPTFTGDPKAPTPATADNDTSIATTAFVKAQGYTTNTGTVTSVGTTNTTGVTWSGGPITTSGNLSITLSTNLQSWSGIAPSTKADDTAVVHIAGTETITGAKTFSNAAFGWSATAARLTGDFSNATFSNRTAFQDKTANSPTIVGALPNGTSTTAGFRSHNTSDANNASYLDVRADSDVVRFRSGFQGTGALKDIVVDFNGTERYRFISTGAVFQVASAGSGNGYIQLNEGVPNIPGYVAFFKQDGTRVGYIGYSTGSNDITFTAEAGWHFNFNNQLPRSFGQELGYLNIPRVTSWQKGCMFATSTNQSIDVGPPVGSTYSVYNDSAAAITLTQGAGMTVRLAGTATTGNRTLAARGFCTIWYNTTTEAIVSGNVT